MIMKIYSIRDRAADAFLQPFFSVNDASSVRSLREVVNDPNHQFSKHADDYSLYLLGTFDDSTGTVGPSELTRIVELSSLKNQPD